MLPAGKGKETHSVGICIIGTVAKPFREHHREFEHFQLPEKEGKVLVLDISLCSRGGE